MPVAVPEAAPSISRIYASFDDNCYQAFRLAMARSRGGVVRVEDLLAALAETQPERTGQVLGLDAAAVARLAASRSTGPDRLPMTNEPALRSVLTEDHTQAAGLPITPALLLRVLTRPLTTRRPPPAAPASPPPAAPPAQPSSYPPLTADSVEAILRRWLEVQSWPSGLRDRVLHQLASFSPPG